MLFFIDYIIVFSFFIGVGIAVDYLGWPTLQQQSSWGQALPMTYILLLYFVVRIGKATKSKDFNYVFYLMAFFVVSVYRYLIGDGSGYIKILATLITPMMAMFWAFDMVERGNKENVKKLFLVLFVVSIMIAIYEKIFKLLLFPYSHFNPEDLNGTIYGEYIRSNSVWGHPLTNAFCVAVIMIFILLSDMKAVYKWTLFAGGFVALFCFGARGAMFMVIVFSILSFVVVNIQNRGFKSMLWNFIFSVVVVLILYFIVYQTNMADRILEEKASVDDSSTNERIEALLYMMNLDSSALFRGIGQDEFLLVHNHVENWILMFIMGYGILITLFFVFFIVHICFCGLKKYPWPYKLCLFGVFIGISLTNNSLAVAAPAFPIFFLCCAVFAPQYSTKQCPIPKTKLAIK